MLDDVAELLEEIDRCCDVREVVSLWSVLTALLVKGVGSGVGDASAGVHLGGHDDICRRQIQDVGLGLVFHVWQLERHRYLLVCHDPAVAEGLIPFRVF